jgi:phosphoserine phosphatase
MAKKPIKVAIAYDFDGTLAPGNMQERDFIPAIQSNPNAFWQKAKRLAREHEGDEILAYMGLMLKRAKAEDVRIRKEDFQNFGARLRLFPGLVEYQRRNGPRFSGWFDRINSYASESNIQLSHFVISSGVREMIEGSAIGDRFERIYASAFQFDVNGVAEWPALSVNYTAKTQYLFRINKGSLDVYDHSVINRFVPDEDRAVPFRNIIFIGDGDTDIPCFRLVKEKLGHAIAVYPSGNVSAKIKPRTLMKEGRINYFAEADYREGKSLDRIVKAIIDKIQIDGYLTSFS